MEIVEYPVDGTLDLHTFHPRDVKDLIPEYISVCLENRIYQIRIIHGKGTGTLRRIVHALGSGGSWGATIVKLKD